MVAPYGKKRITKYIVVSAAIILLIVIFTPPAVKINKLHSKIKRQEKIRQALIEKNKQLQKEKELLKQSPEYLEEIARDELGLVKEGEIIYKSSSDSEIDKE
jgi:cell division protein FtsB